MRRSRSKSSLQKELDDEIDQLQEEEHELLDIPGGTVASAATTAAPESTPSRGAPPSVVESRGISKSRSGGVSPESITMASEGQNATPPVTATTTGIRLTASQSRKRNALRRQEVSGGFTLMAKPYFAVGNEDGASAAAPQAVPVASSLDTGGRDPAVPSRSATVPPATLPSPPPVKPKRKAPRRLGVPDGVEMVRNEIGHWVLRAKANPPADGENTTSEPGSANPTGPSLAGISDSGDGGISAEASGSGSAAAPPVKPKRKPPRKLGVPDGVEMVRNEIGHWVLRAKAYPPAEGSAGDDAAGSQVATAPPATVAPSEPSEGGGSAPAASELVAIAVPPMKPKRKAPRKLGVPEGVEMVRNEIGHWVLRAKVNPPSEGTGTEDAAPDGATTPAVGAAMQVGAASDSDVGNPPPEASGSGNKTNPLMKPKRKTPRKLGIPEGTELVRNASGGWTLRAKVTPPEGGNGEVAPLVDPPGYVVKKAPRGRPKGFKLDKYLVEKASRENALHRTPDHDRNKAPIPIAPADGGAPMDLDKTTGLVEDASASASGSVPARNTTGEKDDSPSESEPEETLIEKPNRGGGRGRGKPRGGTQSTRGGVSRTPRASHVDPDDIESEDDMGVSSSVEAVPYNRKGKGKVQDANAAMSESEEEEDESASSSATGLMDVDYGEQEPEPEPERPSTSASDSAVSGIPPENTAAKHPPLRVRLKLSGLRTVMSAASTPNAASTPDPEMSNLRINEDDESESDESNSELESEEEDEEDADDGTPASAVPSRMTARQAVLASGYDAHHISLDEPPSKKKKYLNEAEIALRRSETARKRKHQSQKRQEEEKLETINRLLKKQSSRTRNKRALEEASASANPGSRLTAYGNAAQSHSGSTTPGRRVAGPPMYRWVSSSRPVVPLVMANNGASEMIEQRMSLSFSVPVSLLPEALRPKEEEKPAASEEGEEESASVAELEESDVPDRVDEAMDTTITAV